MYNLGDALKNLTWAEMNKVATHLADVSTNAARNGEETDPHFYGSLLSDLGHEIVKQAETDAEMTAREVKT